MHWAYIVYLLLCLLQLPFFIFLCAGEGHRLPRPNGLVPRPDLVGPGDPWVVFEHHADGDCDWQGGMACALAMLWACFYMLLQRAYEDDEVSCALGQPDTELDWGEESRARLWAEAARGLFWLFVLCQAVVWSAALGSIAHTDGELWLGALFRTAGLFWLTRTSSLPYASNTVRAWPTRTLGVYAYVVLVLAHDAPAVSWPLGLLVLCDLVLVWAHVSERGTTALIVLNARLFYMASTGVLLLLLLFTSGVGSSRHN